MVLIKSLKELKKSLRSIDEGMLLYLHEPDVLNQIRVLGSPSISESYMIFGRLYRNPRSKEIKVVTNGFHKGSSLLITSPEQIFMNFGYEKSLKQCTPLAKVTNSREIDLPEYLKPLVEVTTSKRRGIPEDRICRGVEITQGNDEIEAYLRDHNLDYFLPSLKLYC